MVIFGWKDIYQTMRTIWKASLYACIQTSLPTVGESSW